MRFRLSVVIFAALMFCADTTMAQRISYPEVTLEYSPIFDAPCVEITKQSIEPEAVKELENRLDSFREHWRKDAPKLFGTTVKITGVKFQFRETKAALYLCQGFGYSMSLPLLINMRYFISAIQGERVSGMPQFSYLVFHETLHRYVSDRIKSLPDSTTPLLTKYRGEPLPVRNHLHLFSIMNEVYRKLDRQKDLDAVIAFEQTLKTAPILKRAREIVDKEGAEAFIREIRQSRY